MGKGREGTGKVSGLVRSSDKGADEREESWMGREGDRAKRGSDWVVGVVKGLI